MIPENILLTVREYYTEKIRIHGMAPRGVDWNSQESQQLRFVQLMKIHNSQLAFSITDYGCGYGALVDYLVSRHYSYKYQGFDIAEEMIKQAKGRYDNQSQCEFYADSSELQQTDYVVASGIFNVKLQTNEAEWLEYLLTTLMQFNNLSRVGFAFNILTHYADPERMRTDLYYADPLFLFDYCKRKFSRFVTLLHDYPLYEFTILVRK